MRLTIQAAQNCVHTHTQLTELKNNPNLVHITPSSGQERFNHLVLELIETHGAKKAYEEFERKRRECKYNGRLFSTVRMNEYVMPYILDAHGNFKTEFNAHNTRFGGLFLSTTLLNELRSTLAANADEILDSTQPDYCPN